MTEDENDHATHVYAEQIRRLGVERDSVNPLAPTRLEQKPIQADDNGEGDDDHRQFFQKDTDAEDADHTVAGRGKQRRCILGRLAPDQFDDVLKDQGHTRRRQNPGVGRGPICKGIEWADRNALQEIAHEAQDRGDKDHGEHWMDSSNEEGHHEEGCDHHEVTLTEVEAVRREMRDE